MARTLRAHGQEDPWVHVEVGYNSRLDELQAAALRVLLPELEGWTVARRAAAAAYERAGIADLVAPQRETEGGSCAYHLYVVRTPGARRPGAGLRAGGIETRAYYTTPLNRQPAIARGLRPALLANSERLAADGLALPMGQALDEAAVRRVVEAIRALS